MSIIGIKARQLRRIACEVSLSLVTISAAATASNAVAQSCYLDVFIEEQEDPERFVMDLVDVVIEGKAIARWTETEEIFEKAPRVRKMVVAFQVEMVHKGDNLLAGTAMKLSGTSDACSCVKDFELGKSYRVLAIKPERADADWRLRYCNFSYEVT